MSQSEPGDENGRPRVPASAVRHCIRFVQETGAGQTVLMEFADPVPSRAVRVAAGSEAQPADAVDILAAAGTPQDHGGILEEMTQWVAAGKPAPAPITITLHGTQVVWRPGRAAILAAPERLESLLLAVVDFSYYESQLGKLERETAESWPQLEADTPLAFEVTTRDLQRREDVGRQVQRMLTVRMRHARIAPRLLRPGAYLATLANQLGERLREKARIEDRLETLAGQLEVFERIYEMSSQRFSDFRTSRQEQTLEWIIILLLAAEVLLLLIEVYLAAERH